ncbi:MAG TPA: hypothetical protein DCM02_09675 [Flavobacterium sp.]|nr:hypothetical protein [Flavobacterium sp.]
MKIMKQNIIFPLNSKFKINYYTNYVYLNNNFLVLKINNINLAEPKYKIEKIGLKIVNGSSTKHCPNHLKTIEIIINLKTKNLFNLVKQDV